MMKIKRYEAKDISSALALVKAELGDEAVILKTRHKQGQDPASGAKTHLIEVLAAVDFEAEPGKHASEAVKKEVPPPAGSRVAPPPPTDQAAGLRPEIAGQWPRPPLVVLHEIFVELGLDQTLQHKLAGEFFAETGTQRAVASQDVKAWLAKRVKQGIAAAPPGASNGQRLWWAFIGPTGVGKTTTLAKVAAHYKFRCGLKGVMVTVDTYRLGGVEQLRRYADLMEIELEVVPDIERLPECFGRHRDKDFVFVDTTGRSPRDTRHLDELSQMFRAIKGLKGQAFLCANHKMEDLRAVISRYMPFPLAGWVVSKLDETCAYGPLWHPLFELGLPISYLTTGQRVPEDIQTASVRNILEILLSTAGSSGNPLPLTESGPDRRALHPAHILPEDFL